MRGHPQAMNLYHVKYRDPFNQASRIRAVLEETDIEARSVDDARRRLLAIHPHKVVLQVKRAIVS